MRLKIKKENRRLIDFFTFHSHRDIRNQQKIEHIIQVQLRFCLLETSSDQEDYFPPNVIVKVNNKLCPLPVSIRIEPNDQNIPFEKWIHIFCICLICPIQNPIPTNKPGVEPKRPPRPVNITTNVKLSPTVANNINVSWCTDFNKGFVISAYLVKKLTSSQLLQRMKAKGIAPVESTRSLSMYYLYTIMCSYECYIIIIHSIIDWKYNWICHCDILVKDKLKEDADGDIATTELRVSLMCPLGKMRMTTPCR